MSDEHNEFEDEEEGLPREPLECPFCQSDDVALTDNRLQRRGQVYCRNCGASGPLRNSRKEFIRFWNQAARIGFAERTVQTGWNLAGLLVDLCESFRALNDGDCAGCELLAKKLCPLHNDRDNMPGYWLELADPRFRARRK